MTEQTRQIIGRAVGCVPSGLFVLPAAHAGEEMAILASWVQQAAFEPLAVSIAMAGQRPIGRVIREARTMALSILGEGDSATMKRFARGVDPDEGPFAGMNVRQIPSGLRVLAGAVAYLDCRLFDVFDFGGDHELFLAEVTAGEVLQDNPAFMHQRGNGLRY